VSEAGSGIEGLRHGSPFAEYVASRLKDETFKLIDIGCAGGLARGWRAFGERLAALGFDTNAEEIARLQAQESNPDVRYVAGWVGMPDGHPLKQRIGPKAYWHQWPASRLAYERTYNVRGARAEGRDPKPLEDYFRDEVLAQDWLTTPVGGYDLDYARTFEVFPVSQAETEAALAPPGPDQTIHLPPYLKASGFYDADFLKLDIDGPDYEVLRSLTDLLAQPSLIGVSLEVSYYGSHDANDNSFHNMDRLMREKGFDLFGLSVRTYAAAALPFPYLDAHPSMNTGGRPVQGDALYVRDLGSRVRREDAAALSDEKLAKTAALLALFTLPDSAAEILIVHRERLSRILDVDYALDLLTAEIQPDETYAASYRDYIALFEADDPRVFDHYTARNTWMAKVIQLANDAPRVSKELEEAHKRLEDAEQALRAERERANTLEADAARLRQQTQLLQDQSDSLRQAGESHQRRVAAIEDSSSWRLTAPLRGAIAALKGRRRAD
jgi:hypothetical protein